MDFVSKNWKGIALCLVLAIPAYLLGKRFPIIGGPVFAILGGMLFSPAVKKREYFQDGIKFTSKKIKHQILMFYHFP